MTAKRLEELKKKFTEAKGDINDLGEILCDLFQSNSNHLKDLKTQISEIKNNQEIIYEDINDIKNLMDPVYTIIQNDEETDQDE
jgi:hypothetical protein